MVKEPYPIAETSSAPLSTAEKVVLFRRLFRGRSDVFPVRWESAKGKSGYSPVCGNEWKSGLCNKPRVKCGECNHRQLLPLTDQVIYDHLSGHHTAGVYPLLADDSCYFLAADFDKSDWQDDARAFVQACRDFEIPSALEVSRSGKGAHVWIFFAGAVPARDARQLGSALISHTCQRTRQLSLGSYDRLFPNQDTMPKGGFGNLIALPLQKIPREHGCSVFVDEELKPYSDQWSFLASVMTLSRTELEGAILHACGGQHPLDVAFASEESQSERNESMPWRRPEVETQKLPIPLPESLTLVLANQIFITKSELPQALANRLIRLAAFQNPEFYKAQAMRFPVWNKPRIIGCAENHPHHIGLPRGCLDAVLTLLEHNGVCADLQDERVKGKKVRVKFRGKLRKDQRLAVREMMRHDIGVLSAPTAFGKTVTAAALIARRKVSTLILVHRTELMRQWQERLLSFLDIPADMLGCIGGGKKKPTGKIDIAVMQSLSRYDDLPALLDDYGMIIVDECHHLSAFSFESVLKQAKSKFVLGLTATPIRRDGHHPIIFMQCGPIRHKASRPENAPANLEVWPHQLNAPEIHSDAGIQDVFRILINDPARNNCIVHDILTAYGEGFDHPPLDTLIMAMPISWKGTLQQYAGRLHREHADKKNVRIYDYVETNQSQLARMWNKRQRGYCAMGYIIKEFPPLTPNQSESK